MTYLSPLHLSSLRSILQTVQICRAFCLAAELRCHSYKEHYHTAKLVVFCLESNKLKIGPERTPANNFGKTRARQPGSTREQNVAYTAALPCSCLRNHEVCHANCAWARDSRGTVHQNLGTIESPQPVSQIIVPVLVTIWLLCDPAGFLESVAESWQCNPELMLSSSWVASTQRAL